MVLVGSNSNSLQILVTTGNNPIPFIKTSFDKLPYLFPFSFDYLSTLDWTQFSLYFLSFIHPLDSFIPPVNMPKTVMDLPPPGTKDALSFRGDNENHCLEHGVTTDADLKKYIGKYADLDTAKFENFYQLQEEMLIYQCLHSM